MVEAPQAEGRPIVGVDFLRGRRDRVLRVFDGLGERLAEQPLGQMGELRRQRLAGNAGGGRGSRRPGRDRDVRGPVVRRQFCLWPLLARSRRPVCTVVSQRDHDIRGRVPATADDGIARTAGENIGPR
jgi:hypothetical protein